MLAEIILTNAIFVLLGWFVVIPPYFFCWRFVRDELNKSENTEIISLIFLIAVIPGILVFYGLTLCGLIQLNKFI